MSDVKHGRLLRVVLDTTVYFSASRSVVFRLVSGAQHSTAAIFSPFHQAIVQEIAGVLRSDAGWEESRIVRRLKLLANLAEIVQPRVNLRVVIADPDDDRIIECAVDGDANLIVSGDRHLTRLKEFQNIGIVRPAYFLKTLGIKAP